MPDDSCMNHSVYKNVGQDKPNKEPVEVYDADHGTYAPVKTPESSGKASTKLDPSPFGSLK